MCMPHEPLISGYLDELDIYEECLVNKASVFEDKVQCSLALHKEKRLSS